MHLRMKLKVTYRLMIDGEPTQNLESNMTLPEGEVLVSGNCDKLSGKIKRRIRELHGYEGEVNILILQAVTR